MIWKIAEIINNLRQDGWSVDRDFNPANSRVYEFPGGHPVVFLC